MKYIFLIYILISLTIPSLAQSNQWNEMASFGGGERERAVSFSLGLKGYIATGQDSANIVHNDLWEYEPASNTWTQKASIPTPGRRNAVGFSINNKGYVGTGIDSPFGIGSGGNSFNDFWEYTPQTNTWVQKANYPDNSGLGIYFGTGFSIGNKGYICCGKKSPSNYSKRTYEYNPTANTWTQKANFLGGDRYALTSFTINQKGYVGTGVDEDLMQNDFYAFTPSTNSWTQIADIPIFGRSACSSFSFANQGFILFGTDGGFKKELWEYHPIYDMWFSKSDFPGNERKGAIAFSIGNKGYAGTGKGSSGGLKKNFYEYTPAAPVGLNNLENILKISTYPNPATNYVVFSFKEEITYTITFFDNKGILIANTFVSKNKNKRIDLSKFSTGLYFYQIKINNTSNYINGKLIVKK